MDIFDEDAVIADSAQEVSPTAADDFPSPQDEEEAIDINEDIDAFKLAYPNVRLEKLVTNQTFISFGRHRFGNEPFTKIYEEFQKLVKTIESAALARKASRSERSTGGGQSTPYTGLTRAQSEQLEVWNKAYPHLKMTPREFLSK
ncbi:MAG: hypothetical protein FWG36_07930 [Oscillospiraceae bacterium]|nr:hypothetical protein [Oscillospiraceae bacterium]